MDETAPGAALYQKMLDGGAPADQAEQWRQSTRQKMLEGGAPPADVDKYWGTTDPDVSPVHTLIADNINRLPPEEHQKIAESPVDMFAAGYGRSVLGLAAGPPTKVMPEHAGLMSNILFQSGQFVGDIPATVAGFLGGGAAGAAATAETGPGAVFGALAGAGAGAAALPEAMRSVLMDQYAHPNGSKTWSDVWARSAHIAWDTTKAALTGAVAAPVGGAVGGKLLAAGGSKAAATLADLGTQAATATTVGAGLDGRVPDAQDFIAGAAIGVGFHVAGSVIGATGRFVPSDTTKLVAENMRDNYRDLGIPPQHTGVPASENVVLNTEITAPHAADGSRVTPLLDAMRPAEPEPYHVPEAPKEGEEPLPPTPAETVEAQNTPELKNERALAIQGDTDHDMPPSGEIVLAEGGGPPRVPPTDIALAEGGEPPGEPALKRTREQLVEDVNSIVGTQNPPSIWANFKKFFAGFQSELAPAGRLDRRIKALAPNEMSIEDMMRQTYASKERAGYFVRYGTMGFEADPNGGVRVTHTGDDSYLKAMKQVKDAGGNQAEFQAYRLAHRTIEKAGQGIETGVDLETARQLLAEPGIEEMYAEAAATIKRVKDASLEYARQSGVFSDRQIEAMKELNEYHIVMRRIMDPSYDPPVASRGFGQRRSIKIMEGSDRRIVDPTTAEMDNLHTIIAMADMNRARGNIIGLIESKNKIEPGLVRLEHMQALDTGEKLPQQVLDEDGNVIPPTIASATEPFLAQRSSQLGRNDFIFYRNGRGEVWRAHDQDLADLMRQQGPVDPPGIVKLAQSFASLARAGITGSFDFPFRAVLHGQIASAALADRSAAPFHDIMSGIMSVWNKDEHYRRWLMNGGAGVALSDMDRNYLAKDMDAIFDKTGTTLSVWNAVRAPLDAMRSLQHMVDAASRVGYMKRVENQGLGTMKAATLSRTAYLDHAEPRANAWVREFARTVPFMEIGFKDIEQVVSAIRDRPVSTLLKASAWITAPTVINYAMNWLADQDLPAAERYDQLPRWERDMYWVLPPVNGVRMKIKRPYVAGYLFGTLPERFMDELRGQDGFEDFAKTLAAQALPPVIPSIISPFAEQWANKSLFTGRPLIKASLERNSGWMQYQPDTTETAKAISRYLGPAGISAADVSPIILDNYVKNWAGPLPMTILRTLEAPFKPPSKPWEIADLPFVGAFFARQEGSGAKGIEDFYQRLGNFQQTAADIRLAIRHHDPEELRLAQNEGTVLQGLAQYTAAERRLSAVIAAIDRDPAMTNDEKRKRTDQLADGMLKIAKGGIDIIDRAEAMRKQRQ